MSTRAWHSVFAQNGWKPHHSPAGRTHRSAPYDIRQNGPYSSNAFCLFPAPPVNKQRTLWQHQRSNSCIMLPYHRSGRPMCLPAVGTPYSPKMDGNRTTPPPGGHIGPHPTASGKMARIHPMLFVFFLPILANKRRTLWQHQRSNSCIMLPYHRSGRPMCLPAVGTPYSPKMDGNRTTPPPGGHMGPHPTACGKIAGIHPTLFVTFLPILANKRRTPWQHQRINSCIALPYHRWRGKMAGIDPTLFVFFLPPLANKIRRNKKTGTAWPPPDRGIYNSGKYPGRNHAEISCRGLSLSCGISPPIKPISL